MEEEGWGECHKDKVGREGVRVVVGRRGVRLKSTQVRLGG